MFCPECRHKYQTGTYFCQNCRHSLVIDLDMLTDEERKRFECEQPMLWEERGSIYQAEIALQFRKAEQLSVGAFQSLRTTTRREFPSAAMETNHNSVGEDGNRPSFKDWFNGISSIIGGIVGVAYYLIKYHYFQTFEGSLATSMVGTEANIKTYMPVILLGSIGSIIYGLIGSWNLFRDFLGSQERVYVICPKCKTRGPDDQLFCGQCGSKLT